MIDLFFVVIKSQRWPRLDQNWLNGAHFSKEYLSGKGQRARQNAAHYLRARAGSVIGPRSARLGCLVRERNGPRKVTHSVTQQSEEWRSSSSMESEQLCPTLTVYLSKGQSMPTHSPCQSLDFTPHFADLQSGLPCVGIGEWQQSPLFLISGSI